MTDDELQAIEARTYETHTVSQPDVAALVAEVRRLRRFVKGALIALPGPVGKALLDDCGMEYAENTTPMT